MKRLLALVLTLTLALTLMVSTALGAEEGDLSITWMPGYRLDTDYVVSSAGTVMAVEEATGLMGVLDAQGNVVTPFTYQSLMGYRGRRDFVEILDGDTADSVRLIDAWGSRVDLPYDFIPDFFSGLSPVTDPKTGLTGYINKDFELVIPCLYRSNGYFLEDGGGYVVADQEGVGSGLLDKQGNFAIPGGWDGVEAQSRDSRYLVVTRGEEQALIQRETGTVIIPAGTYDRMAFQRGDSGEVLVVYQTVGESAYDIRSGVVDLEGKVLVPVQYTDIRVWDADYIYSGTCFLVESESGWGLLDSGGKELLPCQYNLDMIGHMGPKGPSIYDVLHELHPEVPEYVPDYDFTSTEGLSRVTETGEDGKTRYGYRDEAGNTVVPVIFDAVSTMHNGYCMVAKDGVYGLLRDPRGADKVSDWARDEVATAREKGLVTATAQSYLTYPITRLQFAELVVNLVETTAGTALEPAPAGRFADTGDSAALKAAQAGIVNGTGDGSTFEPDALITREQIAAMLYRAERHILQTREGQGLTPAPLDPTPYRDADQISPWAVEAMGHLISKGILNGTSDTTLSPKEYTTVEQAILLILRAYEQDAA